LAAEKTSAVSFGRRQVSPAQKKALVQEHFDTVASRYDLTNTLLSFGQQLLWKRQAIKMLQPQPGERVLDVCGGTADLSLLAAPAVQPSGLVVVYDFNRAMLEIGQKKIHTAGLSNLVWCLQGDAENLALPEHSFEAVMVSFGIRNLISMEQGLSEMYRVLKPGGRLLILEFSQPTNAWFRALYDLYSFTVMPLASKIMMGSWQAYQYLSESIRLFPNPDALSEILANLGFVEITYRSLSNGIAVIHLGHKERVDEG
jgi:demethylmenaquinone methyltransferase / 2-methoxy-6-polyprenyl-1,4-benzoquinol methylase